MTTSNFGTDAEMKESDTESATKEEAPEADRVPTKIGRLDVVLEHSQV